MKNEGYFIESFMRQITMLCFVIFLANLWREEDILHCNIMSASFLALAMMFSTTFIPRNCKV